MLSFERPFISSSTFVRILSRSLMESPSQRNSSSLNSRPNMLYISLTCSRIIFRDIGLVFALLTILASLSISSFILVLKDIFGSFGSHPSREYANSIIAVRRADIHLTK
ncbi:108aa long hypothetical protein [Pyrococcus horikoshii OT3]|uniref:Uncharacterized protein n=1 Tax=Pyrococcus horikoshii (strain ATCC 700860 / DSM 12428 / JCM 9974 / NBRC 100139 / OT-3) TaxID=70601 RepID=O58483_PYRHO|nr:108aa long hypothetical protein [Pyrococcus horikoshii OT3]